MQRSALDSVTPPEPDDVAGERVDGVYTGRRNGRVYAASAALRNVGSALVATAGPKLAQLFRETEGAIAPLGRTGLQISASQLRRQNASSDIRKL